MVSRSNTVEVRIFGDISDISRKLKTLERQSQGMDQKLSALGGSLTRNVTVPLAGLGVAAVKVASDLGESINAVNVIFGEGADKVLEFGENAAESVGLSQRAFNNLATPLGAVFQNFGDSADVAADKTIALTQRAADMASVFNVDVSEALSAIQAALRGEADPIERFGVSVNAAAVEAKALALGLAETKSAIDDQDKAMARYALIMEQTSKVQGDFANTSDSLANKTRILKADAEDVAAALGSALLPVAEDVVGVVGNMTEAFGNLSPETQENIVKMTLFAAAMGPAAFAAGKAVAAIKGLHTAMLNLNLVVASFGGTKAALAALGAAAGPIAATAAGVIALGAAAEFLEGKFGDAKDQIESSTESLEKFHEVGGQAEKEKVFVDELSESYRDNAEAIEEAVDAIGGFYDELGIGRNVHEQAIFMTERQAEETEELDRIRQRLRTPVKPGLDIDEYQGKIVDATIATRNLRQEQLALVDPLFARALAEQRAAEAQERLAEVQGDGESSARDVESAVLDVLVAEAELDVATKDLSDTIDLRAIRSLEELRRNANLTRESISFLTDDIRDLNGRLAELGLFLTSDGQVIPIRDVNNEIIRINTETVE